MKQKKYFEQYQRMKRWYEVYQKINNGILLTPNLTFKDVLTSPLYQDYVFFFFQNCYHLKDWIINDYKDKTITNKVESFIDANPCMAICADICNSTKHLSLKKSRSKRNPQFTVIPDYTEVRNGKKGYLYIEWFLKADDGELIDAFKIATECVDKWTEFIKNVLHCS